MPRLGPGRPRSRPDRVRADKAYDPRRNRAYLRRRGIKATIPVPADRVRTARNSAQCSSLRAHSPPSRPLVARCRRRPACPAGT
ncbi:hypothetical protein [Streptomyces mirabilis]|uniref:Transposase DDE domain-containing protein n=1 Tax=Streptomyces mirabilis TaxID=68239 RepID=A0ABU3V6N5_9ACTN|nr:hypothetical protein [Streptomyces mirabilis]MDU9001819.1 hypothetical protein [Streptomyces mirabilis]